MAKLNMKKVLTIGGGAAAAFLAFNWWTKRSAAQAAELKRIEDAAKAAKAAGASDKDIVGQVMATPAVQEALTQGATAAKGLITSLLSKIGL
jgi:hypothetical protein